MPKKPDAKSYTLMMVLGWAKNSADDAKRWHDGKGIAPEELSAFREGY